MAANDRDASLSGIRRVEFAAACHCASLSPLRRQRLRLLAHGNILKQGLRTLHAVARAKG
jgi:hypothetical protein